MKKPTSLLTLNKAGLWMIVSLILIILLPGEEISLVQAAGQYSSPDAPSPFRPEPIQRWGVNFGYTDELDRGQAVDVDPAGNIYVTGLCRGTWGTPVRAYSDGEDACVLKLDPDGTLIWNTFLGSDNQDWSHGIAVDDSGNSYVIGTSYGSWGSPLHAYSGHNHDIFVAKLNTSGDLQWHTFWGSTQDRGYGIALDGTGNIYITGKSYGSWGTPINPHTGTLIDGNDDAYVAKLSNEGALIWNTFLGADEVDGVTPGADVGTGIALDSSGNVFIGGTSDTSWGSPIDGFSGDGVDDKKDGFAVKLNNSGILQWNTFFGSEEDDEVYDVGSGVGVDQHGNVYLTGYSDATWGSPITLFNDDSIDIFLIKLDSSGNRTWSTFSGLSGGDWPQAIHVDPNGNSYIVGGSSSPNLFKYNASGKLTYSTNISAESFYGITRSESGFLIPVGYVSDNEQDLYVVKALDPHTPTADFTGSGSTDISIYRPSNGNWYISGEGYKSWGLPGDLPAPGDYDGNGVIDIAVFRPSNGKWYIREQGIYSWGTVNDIPMPCDYDGDGDDDIAVYRPSNGNWYIMGEGYQSWGLTGDIPVPADYDGNGTCDIAVFRPSNNKWYIMGQGNESWAAGGDIPVPGDYDGDGYADIAVYRPSNGNWYIKASTAGNYYQSWGLNGDIPVPGDYDGDGTLDIAVLRPSNGKWYIMGETPVKWFAPGDFPLPVRDTNADGDPYQ